MKTRKSIFIITAALLFTLFSCSNGFQESNRQKTTKSPDGKTYIKLGDIDIVSELGRNINPATGDYNVENLTDIVLKGYPGTHTADEIEFNEPATYAQIKDVLIPLDSNGVWHFTLTAKKNDVSFSGTKTMTIQMGSINTLSMTLKPQVTYGGMNIKMSFTIPGVKQDYKVVAKLFYAADARVANATPINTKEFTADDFVAASNASTNKTFSVNYSRSVADENERLQNGTYWLVFEFYDLNITEALNTSENFVGIAKGITTTGSLSLDLNESYKINYHYIINGEQDDNFVATPAGGSVLTNRYSRKTPTITIPAVENDNYLFMGWYADADMTTSASTVAQGSLGTQDFYGVFINTITVSPEGSSSANVIKGEALDSIQHAADKINELETNRTENTPWIIEVDGTLNASQTFKPAEAINKQDVVLKGKNGIGDDGKPQDKIVGTAGSYVLDVESTSNSLEIQDLMITGGSITGNNGSGLYVRDDSTVTISDGTLITGNTTDRYGPGVYLGENAYLYLQGGIIENNVSSNQNYAYGTGIYASDDSKVYVSGAPVVDDLYPETYSQTINLYGVLWDGASITITPQDPYYGYYNNSGDQFVYEESDSVKIEDNYEYFHIKPNPNATNDPDWVIDDGGRLNYYCTITYTGDGTGSISSDSVLCGSNIPDVTDQLVEQEGKVFAGWWYEHYDYNSGTTVREQFIFEDPDPYDDDDTFYSYESVYENITLEAVWYTPIQDIYVNADTSIGNDNAAGTASAPLATIQGAINRIAVFNDEARDYTITVSGLTEEHSVQIGNNLPISSLLLQGATADDGINSTTMSNTTPVLDISTAVTIKNMKIAVSSAQDYMDGVAIKINEGATVTLDDGANLVGSGSSINPKGAVSVEDGGTLVMKSGSTIQGFDMMISAVYVKQGGIFTMDGGTIKNNSAQGSSILVEGNFTMNGGEISGNTQVGFTNSLVPGSNQWYNGAGVCVYAGTFKMTGGKIINNKSCVYNNSTSTPTFGGGVYVKAGASFIMEDGEISGNTVVEQDPTGRENTNTSSKANGGGVCIQASGSSIASFTMTGGKISGNHADTLGNAIGFHEKDIDSENISGVITIGGSALITSDNDIYLPDYVTIEITDELTRVDTQDSANLEIYESTPIVTPQNVGRTTPMLALAEDADASLVSEFTKFATTPVSATDGGAKHIYFFDTIGKPSATIPTISYFGIDGGTTLGGQSLITTFANLEDDITLPALKKAGKIFMGWYTEESGGTVVTAIPKSPAQDVSVYAQWQNAGSSPVLYVNPSSTVNYGGIQSCAFKTLEQAFEIVRGSTVYASDWTIKLDGVLTGATVIDSTLLPDSVYLTSVTIEGANTPAVAGNPQDGFDGGFTDATDTAVLSITTPTSKSIILKNIKITGGNNTKTSGHGIGGGLYVGKDPEDEPAKVTLDGDTVIAGNYAENGAGVYTDGTLWISDATITGNRATLDGGGVYNNWLVYMYNNAVIGNKNATTVATYSNGNTTYANYAGRNGGGIYNYSSLYMGSSELFGSYQHEYPDSSQSFTGGIYYNYAESQGGGIFISGSSNVAMYNGNTTIGTMAYNAVGSNGQGGAIYQNGNLSIGGGTWIPAGDNGKHDIYLSEYGAGHYLNIISKGADQDSDCSVLTHNGIVAQLTPIRSGDSYNVSKTIITGGYTSSMTTKKFAITPLTVDGVTTYWDLKYQSSMVKLYQTGAGSVQAGFGIDSSDVTVNVTSGDSAVSDEGVIAGGGTITFTASTPQSGGTYKWYIDGTEEATTNVLEVNTSSWASGIYNISLEATDSSGKAYSYFAQIKIN